jgi:hypothetical protein
MSLVSSSSILLELAMLLWLLVISADLYPPIYICVPGPDVDESIVLVRLPLLADRDIALMEFAVSRGNIFIPRSSSSVGDIGVLGKGLSKLTLLLLLACPACGLGPAECQPIEARSGVAVAARSRGCTLDALIRIEGADANLSMPLRTPAVKWPFFEGQGSSSVARSGGDLNSGEPVGNEVSICCMVNHNWR